MTALLQVQDLCAGYQQTQVLHDLSFQIQPGQIITVIGPNGAGKSTLLKSLMGLLPVKGTLQFEDAPIHDASVERRLDLGIALVPETRELFGPMSVADNLILGGFRHRRDREGLARDLNRVYGLFPVLQERRNQRASTLSGGERQMLALARAMMSRPRLLLLDEPSLGLAPLIVRNVLADVAELRQQGVSVLLVEQNACAALAVADFGYVLEQGKIRLQGPASELAQNPDVIASYLGA